MKLWLDDLRPAPAGWVHAKTAKEAIKLLSADCVKEISLDHDLGEEEDVGSGYDVACFIEENAALGRLKKLFWNIHSANPVGRIRMMQALNNAERFWNDCH